MDLVPVIKTDARQPVSGHVHSSVEMPGAAQRRPQKPSEFTVPVERQQMIGVTYATAERRPLEATLRTVGSLSPRQSGSSNTSPVLMVMWISLPFHRPVKW